MPAYCLICEYAGGDEDDVICLLTDTHVGLVYDLSLTGIPSTCPLPESERVVRSLPRRQGHTHIHFKVPRDTVQDDCLGTYGKGEKCALCERIIECAELWSKYQWNKIKLRKYSNYVDLSSDPWDDIIKLVEK